MKILKRASYKIGHYLLRKKIENLPFKYGLYEKNDRKEKIIVSMTTFPKRIKYLDLCVNSILNQSVKPDRFIIYLGSDCSLEDANYLKLKYERYGVTINYDVNNNYMSHKKYIYSLRDYANDLVITVDDDLIYPLSMIKNLLETHTKYPNCICARRVHFIKWNGDLIEKYNNWNMEYDKCILPSHYLFATTGAGTLFPPKVLPDLTFDFEIIKKYSLYADDVWIKCMSLLNNTKVVWSKNRMQMPAVINSTQDSALYKHNVVEEKNSECLMVIFEKFNISKMNFDRE